MHWWFVVKIRQDDKIVYAYSTDSKKLDGEVVYYFDSEEMIITNPCAFDGNSEWAQNRTLQKFCKVIKEKFPDERHVCCG